MFLDFLANLLKSSSIMDLTKLSYNSVELKDQIREIFIMVFRENLAIVFLCGWSVDQFFTWGLCPLPVGGQ